MSSQRRAINESNARLKAAKSGHYLTLVSKPFQSLVVKYDHDLCMYTKLKDGSMRRMQAPSPQKKYLSVCMSLANIDICNGHSSSIF